MLRSLHIRNLAVIDALSVEFGPGFNVLSGETGAGKSIVFTALGLLLGDRADSGLVRAGEERAQISAEFSLAPDGRAMRWLNEQELGDADAPAQLLLRRQLQEGGQSRAFINGHPVNLRQLKELAECLVDIHGQHAHQLLLRGDEQRALVDDYGELHEPVAILAAQHARLLQIKQLLTASGGGGQEHAQRAELLRYQLEELDALAPDRAEFDALEAEFRSLDEVDALLLQAASASELLYAGNESLYDRSAAALSALQECARIDARFEAALAACEQAQISLKEAGQAAADVAESIEPDPSRLAEVSQRLDRYQDLARKHRCAPVELAEHWQSLQTELAALEAASGDLEALSEEQKQLRQAYDSNSLALSQQRQQVAKQLAAQIQDTLRPLGLPHAQFEIAVKHQPQASRSANGQDSVEYRISANPGQPAAALSKVASGGELARSSLAIQVVCLAHAPVPVLLFDEVDVGISGGIAEVVGRRLKQLAAQNQVFCVTHQPQVAALADQHFGVRKRVEKGATFTDVECLNQAQRVEELARMLGGLKITEQTVAHATEMLAAATSD